MRKGGLLLFSFCLVACGAAQSRGPATPGGAQRGVDTSSAPAGESQAAPSMGPMMPAPVPGALAAGPNFVAAGPNAVGAGPNTQTAGSRGATVAQPPRPEMLDIEANLSIQVDSVPSAAAALRALARRFEGVVTEDRLNQSGTSASAQLTIRVPSGQVDSFFDAVGTVGRLQSRQINAKDIGKEFFDAEIRLENLQATMRRYEEILKQAKNVEEVLRIEGELGRLRGEIEQTKGNLRWLSDRAARATVHINLSTTPHEVAVVAAQPALPPPEAKIHPGLRLVELTDFRGEQGNAGYLGGGVSATFSRHFSVSLDGLRRSGTGALTRGLDVVLFTIGGEMYSDFLGGGKRKFLNPYLGYTIGYTRFAGHNEALVGATLGVELVKLNAITIDLDARAFGLLFGSDGAHVGVEPVLGVSVPF